MMTFIMNGGYNMPPFAGVLKADEANDLIAFLQSRTVSGSAAALNRVKQ